MCFYRINKVKLFIFINERLHRFQNKTERMLNFLIVSVIAFAVLYIAYTYSMKTHNRTCQKVEYRYRPYIRTFKEEQSQPVSPFGLFQNLFHKPSPWWSTRAHSAHMTVGAIQPATWVGLPKDQMIREGEDDAWENKYFS